MEILAALTQYTARAGTGTGADMDMAGTSEASFALDTDLAALLSSDAGYDLPPLEMGSLSSDGPVPEEGEGMWSEQDEAAFDSLFADIAGTQFPV